MAELLSIHPDNPQERTLEKVIDCLKRGGIIIYPTDTVYGLGCDLYNAKAIQKLFKIKGTDPKKGHLSFICYDLSDLSKYARNVSNGVFKVMKKALPGPYTFVLEASPEVPKIIDVRKKQVGIRVPNHNVPRQIVKMLGNPILTTSVKQNDELMEYLTDPYDIREAYDDLVDIVIDSGIGGHFPSTVVSGLDGSFEIFRQGVGDFAQFVDYVS
ncbi:MAG: threonylcarbamoyl-AMP synthase [Cytophagales bacterium]|nr:MAG: threonylcarbamoyl-AMP synthase [Cytophagales bacterium]TAF60772.1 MAG: threonylcarbamoyl-AMP synthase [Cytophagales bacterium]